MRKNLDIESTIDQVIQHVMTPVERSRRIALFTYRLGFRKIVRARRHPAVVGIPLRHAAAPKQPAARKRQRDDGELSQSQFVPPNCESSRPTVELAATLVGQNGHVLASSHWMLVSTLVVEAKASAQPMGYFTATLM